MSGTWDPVVFGARAIMHAAGVDDDNVGAILAAPAEALWEADSDELEAWASSASPLDVRLEAIRLLERASWLAASGMKSYDRGQLRSVHALQRLAADPDTHRACHRSLARLGVLARRGHDRREAHVAPDPVSVSETARKHPHWAEEKAALESVLGHVSAALRGVNLAPMAADSRTEAALARHAFERLSTLHQVEQDPYFARMDVRTKEQEVQTLYVGRAGFDAGSHFVVDWRAPIASVFYRDNGRLHTYKAPSGDIDLELLLKRRIAVQDRVLAEIVDLVDHRSEFGPPPWMMADDYLLRILSDRSARGLQNIVRTIQEQQDRLIRLPSDVSLLVNGVAGSGKTSVAYHRVACLLYPQNAPDITVDTLMVFGPNRLFLGYVRALLPELGVSRVRQSTFEDWALSRVLVGSAKYEESERRAEQLRLNGLPLVVEDPVGDLLLEGKASRAAVHDARETSRLRSSARMLEVARRAIVHWRDFLLDRLPPAEAGLGAMSLQQNGVADRDVVDRIRDGLREAAPERSRRRTRDRLVHSVGEAGKMAPEKARRLVDRLLDSYWPRLDPVAFLYQLYDDTATLNAVAADLFNPQEFNLLTQCRPARDGSVLSFDIPAIAALHCEAWGESLDSFSHIVVDEVQDFSPASLAILGRCCPSGSMTLVGDLAQGILEHRGLGDWAELQENIGAHLTTVDITIAYRPTAEICEFTNALLPGDALHARALPRHGEAPTLLAVPEESYAKAIVDRVKQEVAEDAGATAVIARTAVRAGEIRDILNQEGIAARSIGQDTRVIPKEQVLCMDIGSAKGLEFERVLVVDADDRTYPDGLLSRRLLYVACTRALHSLGAIAAGRVGTILETARERMAARAIEAASTRACLERRAREVDELLALLDNPDEASFEQLLRLLTKAGQPSGQGQQAAVGPDVTPNLREMTLGYNARLQAHSESFRATHQERLLALEENAREQRSQVERSMDAELAAIESRASIVDRVFGRVRRRTRIARTNADAAARVIREHLRLEADEAAASLEAMLIQQQRESAAAFKSQLGRALHERRDELQRELDTLP